MSEEEIEQENNEINLQMMLLEKEMMELTYSMNILNGEIRKIDALLDKKVKRKKARAQ